jgi:hypothetical protein
MRLVMVTVMVKAMEDKHFGEKDTDSAGTRCGQKTMGLAGASDLQQCIHLHAGRSKRFRQMQSGPAKSEESLMLCCSSISVGTGTVG